MVCWGEKKTQPAGHANKGAACERKSRGWNTTKGVLTHITTRTESSFVSGCGRVKAERPAGHVAGDSGLERETWGSIAGVHQIQTPTAHR